MGLRITRTHKLSLGEIINQGLNRFGDPLAVGLVLGPKAAVPYKCFGVERIDGHTGHKKYAVPQVAFGEHPEVLAEQLDRN